MSDKKPIIDSTRRTLLATGAVAAAAAAAPRAFAQQSAGQSNSATSFFENGDVRIHYQDTGGSGFPLLLVPGGGLNAVFTNIVERSPFNAIEEFGDEFRCISMDLRNANPGQSSGPLEVDRPWDSHTDDQLALMDHLGIDKFMVLGFCIGGPIIWNLLERAPDRVAAAVLAQPAGFDPEIPDFIYGLNRNGWGPALADRRPDISIEMVETFLNAMFRNGADFVFSVTREFAQSCETPILVLPDDIPPHPYDVAMESARLAPNAQVSIYPWKEPPERIPMAVRHIRSFLQSHRPQSGA